MRWAERAIAKATAKEYGLEMSDLLGQNRRADISEARQVLMLLLSEKLGYTSMQIGKVLGREYTTISYGIKRVAGLADTDPATARHLDNLRAALTQE